MYTVVPNVLPATPNPQGYPADLLDRALVRKPGGNNNPHGIGGKSGKVVNVDNVQVDNPKAPTGNTESAGLPR